MKPTEVSIGEKADGNSGKNPVGGAPRRFVYQENRGRAEDLVSGGRQRGRVNEIFKIPKRIGDDSDARGVEANRTKPRR